MSEIAVDVEHLEVRYLVHPYRQQKLHEAILRLGRSDDLREIPALQDVSFQVGAGEVLGAVGPNGSGKTTLLKTLAGIVPPTSGRVRVDGRVGTLIELGGGFNPELTGAENIHLQCALVGLSRGEIDARFDRIVEFAGLGSVIDIPVKNYSAGMYMRLGFSIAVQAETDVLLIDEILAVGDLEFQEKSYERILELIDAGTAAVIVSHDLATIETLCDRAMVLADGKLHHLGDVQGAIDCYHELSASEGPDRDEETPAPAQAREYEGQPAVEYPGFEAEGSGAAQVKKVVFLDANDRETATIRSGEALRIRIEYEAKERVRKPVFGLAVFTEDWVSVSGPNTVAGDCQIDALAPQGAIEYVIPSLNLMPGDYLLIASIFEDDLVSPIDHSRRFYRLTVASGDHIGGSGLVDLGGSWSHRPG